MTLQFKASATVDTSWHTLDVDSLPDPIRKRYDAYREAYSVAKAFRQEFEAAFRDAVTAPQGHEAAIGYNYGKLSYSYQPIKAKATAKGAVSFSALARK